MERLHCRQAQLSCCMLPAASRRLPPHHAAALPVLLAVVTYSADRLKPNKKKTFKGHIIAGEISVGTPPPQQHMDTHATQSAVCTS